MAGQKWKLEELKVGRTAEAVFWQNPVEDSPYKLRATHLDAKRAPKVVLTSDKKVVPGVPCLVRIKAITKPDRTDRGAIEVEYAGPAPFRIEGVYLDPIDWDERPTATGPADPTGLGVPDALPSWIVRNDWHHYLYVKVSADHVRANPLPHTLVVRPGAGNTGASMVLLQEELANLPEAEHVQVDTEWVQRFHAILDIVRQAIAIGAGLLGIAIIVIIGNTIRLDIENRREEIEVTKLIGASNAFVRRPFLWTGFWYGLFGGLMALALVFYGLFLLQGPVARLAGLYQSSIAIASMSLIEAAAIIGVGVFLGLFASWFTTARHMRRIEPR